MKLLLLASLTSLALSVRLKGKETQNILAESSSEAGTSSFFDYSTFGPIRLDAPYELTTSGIMYKVGTRTQVQLDNMSNEDERNGIIDELY